MSGTETLMAARQTVVLLHGGRSSEHEISCVTAAGILAAMARIERDGNQTIDNRLAGLA